jgi:hypothetical protein
MMTGPLPTVVPTGIGNVTIFGSDAETGMGPPVRRSFICRFNIYFNKEIEHSGLSYLKPNLSEDHAGIGVPART